MRKVFMFVFAASLMLTAISAFGQEQGRLTGTVTDPNNAVVPGATVTVKSVSTGAVRNATASDDGVFVVTNLNPGQYDVTVQGGSFAAVTKRVEITPGANISLATQLGIQQREEEVTVVAQGGIEVNTTTQELSDVISNTQIRELPTLTRNPYALVGLAGNVNAEPGGGRGTGYNINGQRSASTSILLDGVENVDNFTATVGQAVPLDSVQEFRIITGNFSAEYGRASGGIVNVGTMSGSNEFHGTVYAFNRISKLASNGFDNNANGIPRQVFTRNQFGYSVGGPVMRNKLFFFNSTEWLRVRSGGAAVAWIPTGNFVNAAAAPTRAFFAPYAVAGSPGTTISASQVLAAFGGASQFTPTPNAATNAFLAFATANPNAPVFQRITYSTPQDVGGGAPVNEYQTVVRADYNMTDKTQLYGRWALQDQVFAIGTNASSPYQGFNTGSVAFNQNFLLNITHAATSRLVSQTKIAFNRLNGGQPLGEQPIVPTLYLNPERAVNLQGVNVALPGYLPFSPGNAIPFSGAQNVYQLNEDISYASGQHTWRFGGQFIRIHDNKTFGAYSYAVEGLGLTNGESLSNFLTGNLVRFSVAIDPGNRYPGASIPLPVGPPSFSRSNRYNEWAVYVNDSYRYRPNITFNLGLRYEYYGVQHNSQDPALDANFYYGAGNTYPERLRSGRFFNVPQSPIGALWQKDLNNFAPRLGFAWDITGDGKTSLRGGYGIAYERNFGNVTFNLMFNPPNYGVVALQADRITGGVLTPGDVPNLAVSINNYGPFSGTGPARLFTPVSARHIDENIVNAYAHFWSLSFERELARSTVFSLDYSGSDGRDLYSIGDVNRTGCAPIMLGVATVPTATGGTTTRCNGVATSMNTRGNLGYSNYHGLTAGIDSNNWRKKGLNFTAKYTFSKAMDNLSSTFADTSQTFFLGFTDQYDPALDYGPADFDVRHRVTTGFTYETPWKGDSTFTRLLVEGWSLNGNVLLRSGYPFTIYDCTFGNVTCARLIPTGTVNVNTSNPSDFGTANRFTLVDLSGQTATVPRHPVANNYNFGPFPDTMTKRNSFRGPGFWNVDLGFFKKFKFTENTALQIRAEIFNVFNHANLFTDYGTAEKNEPAVLAFRDGRRNIQLAAKFIF